MTMQPTDLRAAREALGYTLDEMAAALGMSKDTVSRMELGKPGYPIKLTTELAVQYLLDHRPRVEAVPLGERGVVSITYWDDGKRIHSLEPTIYPDIESADAAAATLAQGIGYRHLPRRR